MSHRLYLRDASEDAPGRLLGRLTVERRDGSLYAGDVVLNLVRHPSVLLDAAEDRDTSPGQLWPIGNSRPKLTVDVQPDTSVLSAGSNRLPLDPASDLSGVPVADIRGTPGNPARIGLAALSADEAPPPALVWHGLQALVRRHLAGQSTEWNERALEAAESDVARFAAALAEFPALRGDEGGAS